MQITHIGSEYEKSNKIRETLQKQKNEVVEKFNSLIESTSSKKTDIHTFFNSIREIIDKQEEKLVKEVNEKLENTNTQMNKKLEVFNLQEQSLDKIKDMLNIEIEENIKSKIMFLNDCGVRNEIITKANKPIASIKYPQPPTKLREDRETEEIIKEIKQRSKPARKRATPAQKKASNTPAVSKNKVKETPDNFSQSMKVSKKASPDKNKMIKSPQTHENASKNTKRKSEIIKAKKMSDQPKPSANASRKPKQIESKREPPKVIKEALLRQHESVEDQLNMENLLNEKREKETTDTPQKNFHKFLTNQNKESQQEYVPSPPKEAPKRNDGLTERQARRNLPDESTSAKKQNRLGSASRKMWDKKPHPNDRAHRGAERPQPGHGKGVNISKNKQKIQKDTPNQEQGENRAQEEPAYKDKLAELRNRRKAQKRENNDYLSEEFKHQMNELEQVTSNILSRETFMLAEAQDYEDMYQQEEQYVKQTPPQMVSLHDWDLVDISQDPENLILEGKEPIHRHVSENLKSGRSAHHPNLLKRKK
ncbi:unnamed protein product [Moneuplotes crassus]|uniref:Uncharacterized protein n=1 Tax=Euplotes crassus TaxID=5936 RepID=A0AAD1X5M9_EUPCR|nr:unnamed protein product [Moneuplotes crassus]